MLGNAPGPPLGMGDLMSQMPNNAIHARDLLYRLIISQLFYDGYQQVAVTLSNIVHADPPCPAQPTLSSTSPHRLTISPIQQKTILLFLV